MAALLIGQLDAGPGGEALDGLGEGEVVDLLHEPDDVAAVRAGEAVPQATGRGHVEGRGLLVVERAQPLERAAAGVAELEVFTDHIGDGRLLADHRDVLVADPACHSHPSLQRSRRGESSLRHPHFAGPPGTWRGGFGHACYRRRVRWLLVLWDIDFTLINAGGVGTRLYRMVFRDMFGTELPGAADMAGRTDRAIVADTLARAGIPEPRRHLDQILANLAAQAPAGRELAVQHSRALPGAAAALDALAAFAPERDGAGQAGTGRRPGGGPAPRRDGTGDGATDLSVVQSVLTGNVRLMAEMKLGAVGLDGYLDF